MCGASGEVTELPTGAATEQPMVASGGGTCSVSFIGDWEMADSESAEVSRITSSIWKVPETRFAKG